MRVRELSKELNITNKELQEYLSVHNSEIKSHNSSLTDEEVAMAKKKFGAAPKEDAKEPAKAPAEPKEQPKEAAKEAPQGEKAAPPKKKISQVFNPQYSGRKEIRDRRPENRDRRPDGQRPDNRDRKPEGQRPNDRYVPKPEGQRASDRFAQKHDGQRPSDRFGQKPERPEGGRPDNRERRQDGPRPSERFAQKHDGQRPSDRFGQKPERPEGQRPDNRERRPEGGRPDNRDRRPEGGRPDNRNGFNDNRDGRDNRDNRRGQNDRNFRKEDKSVVASFDGADAIKEREAKEQRSRERENRKKDSNNYDKHERQENTKALEKAKKNAKPQPQPKKEEEETIKTLILPDTLTIKELADKMKVAPAVVVKKLFLKGTMVTINQEVDFDTAEEIALEFNCICEHEVKVDVIEELLKEEEEAADTLVPRPPVVCVMGHVDHGKTSLLDAIRSSNVTSREAGGITQHIGAYTVEAQGQAITFLDTPGHEAFTAMRLRGAKSTDIAILVVAADDGVMPQTVEAINHAKAAGIEIVVAINKIDKPSANIDRVKQELVEYELIAEDWGGSTIFCPVSAHTKEGIDNLLDMLLLTAEMLELKANPDRRARGLVIEGRLDKGKGTVATLLVQKGTLHVGDNIAVGSCYGKIRAMTDDKGRRIQEAGPSIPVEILGLGEVPNAGDVFVSPETEKEARAFAETFIREGRVKMLDDTKARMSLDDLFSQIQAGNLKELNIIVKADVQGSVEAVKQSLVKLSNDEVVVKVIHAGVGAVNESDVILASASNAIIIAFNVRPDNQARIVAEQENVDLRLYRVIYQAIEDVEAAMKGMLEPTYEEKVIGHAEVRATYKASGIGTIAGSYVLDGYMKRGCSIRLMRGKDIVYDGPLASLKRFKDDAKEVKEGYECGCVLEKFNDIAEGDILEAYMMVEVPR